MFGAEGDSQSCGVFGDGWEADGWDQVAVFLECCGSRKGGLVISEDYWEDGAWVVFSKDTDVLKKRFAECRAFI